MSKAWYGTVAALLILTTMRASAHHSFSAEYDENSRVTISGAVSDFKWINPHAWLYVDRKDREGKVTQWSFELGSPAGLTASGWKKTDLKSGDQIKVEGFRAKDGSNKANAAFITLPGGRRMFGGFTETPGAPPKVAY
jgi:Family of unknown function (DUF6152)